MATIRIAATGDKEKGINEINPRFQANALRNIRGIDCGVLANNFYSEDRDYYGINKVQTDATLAPFRMISCASSGIQIGAGMATAYGYDFQLEESETVSVLDDGETSLSSYISNTSGTRYVFVYLEWDITGDPGIGSVKLHGNGTASIWRSLTTSNANLIDNPRGIYKLPIYRVEITNGTLTYVSWEDMNLCPTITRPQVAEVARFAEDPTGVGDEIANTRYVTNRCDEDMATMQAAIDAINSNFSRDTFTILNVPCDILKENGVVYITSDHYGTSTSDTCSPWSGQMNDISTGDTIGVIPNGFYPKEDKDVYMRFFGASVYTMVGSTTYTGILSLIVTFQSQSNGGAIIIKTIVSDTISSSGQNAGRGTPSFCFNENICNYGYETATESIPTIYTKHTLILNYDSSKVCATAPTYYEIGVPFTLKAIALGYGEECVIEVTGGSISGGADGEYTVTPTSTVCIVSISTRYFNGGTDENGDENYSPAPYKYTFKHEVSIRGESGSTYVHINFTDTNDDATTYDTLEKIYDHYGTSEIPATGEYSLSGITFDIYQIVVDKDYTVQGSSATGYVRIWATSGSESQEVAPAVWTFFTEITDDMTLIKEAT